jgi:hypothetical protein
LTSGSSDVLFLFVSRQPEKQARAEAMLGAAFQKTSRVVRLTLALSFKLERDAAREAQAEAPKVQQPAPLVLQPQPADDRIERRKTRVHNLLNRLLWTESEGEEEDFEILTEDLLARLDEAALNPDFEVLPIEVLTQRMIADMGLRGELTLSLCEIPPDGGESSPPLLADTG